MPKTPRPKDRTGGRTTDRKPGRDKADRPRTDRAKTDRAGAERPKSSRPPGRGPARGPVPLPLGVLLGASAALLEAMAESPRGADRVAADWFRTHDRLDGGPRGPIMERVEAVLRHGPQLDWWIGTILRDVEPTTKLRLITAHILVHERPIDRLLVALVTPEPQEQKLIRGLETRTLLHPHMPLSVRAGIPDWLIPRVEAAFGPQAEHEFAAQLAPPPVDLRVNTLKLDRKKALALLERQDLHPRPTPLSPLGIRLSPRTDIGRIPALQDGLVEVQDEGSQIAALLVDARPGQQVIDFCAGAGGKALVMAAQMKNKGHLAALDVHEKRIARARQRLKRAGAENAEARVTDAKWLRKQAGRADRVLVDAPCTGTGTWRRNPDARWRLREQDIIELLPLQAGILDQAATLVKPGGRLVYATCSLLPEENERQVEAFLARHEGFRILSVADLWPATVGGAAPSPAAMLHLSPARHGTDGFFVAVLERAA